MTPDEEVKYREACKQTDAIFALEGFDVTPEKIAIREAVIAGRVTLAKVIAEKVEYVKQHKTIDGFIQSRPWA
jgi:hypothetical protein